MNGVGYEMTEIEILRGICGVIVITGLLILFYLGLAKIGT